MKTYHTLRQKLGFCRDLPYTKDWSAAADFLERLADYCLTHQPQHIVECSSGLSTLILARCCEINQNGKVLSLENGVEYARHTRESLDAHALNAYATVQDAPLKKICLKENEYQWYQTKNIHISKIDLLVIDGPNGYIQKNARYPALPVLKPFFSKHCTVFLDDAAREDEREIVSQWQQQYRPLSTDYIETERGCVILKF